MPLFHGDVDYLRLTTRHRKRSMQCLKDLPSPSLGVDFEVCPRREPYSVVECHSALVPFLVVEIYSAIEVCSWTERSFVKKTLPVLDLYSAIGLFSASVLYFEIELFSAFALYFAM